MTNVRRFLVVLSGLAVTAMISSAFLRGEAASPTGKVFQLPAEAKGTPGKPGDADLLADPLQFHKQPLISYEPIKGDPLFALQVQPDLPNAPRRPRDLLVLVCTTASQAGAAFNSSRQLAEQLIKNAKPEDRIALWVMSTPDAKHTRCLTGDFVSPDKDTKAIDKALAELKAEFPAGHADLKHSLQQVTDSFTSAERHRIIVYLGDGQDDPASPLTSSERNTLCQKMVDKKITFFPMPLGANLHSANLHGLATGTGGKVVRVKIFEEGVEDAANRAETAFTGPVLYPSADGFKLSGGVIEYLPSRLPPLRKDTPTLVTGKFKGLKELTYTVSGTVDGVAGSVSKSHTLAMPEANKEHYFLVSLYRQWQQAPGEHTLTQADRALVSAFQKNRMYQLELVDFGGMALANNDLVAAQKLFQMANQVNPHDTTAKAGLEVVANLKSGKLTKKLIEEQLKQSLHAQGIKLEKIGGQLKITKGQLLDLAKAQVKPKDGEAGPKEPDLFQAHKDLALIEEQRIRQNVEEVIQKARDLLKSDPEAAQEMLRQALLQTQEHPDLTAKTRAELAGQLKTSLRYVTIHGQAIVEQKAAIAQAAQAALAGIQRQDQAQAEVAQMEAKFNIYKALLNQARYEEKVMRDIQVGMLQMQQEAKLKGMDPPVQTQPLSFTASARFNLQKLDDLRQMREKAWLETMMNVEKTHIPFPDEPPIVFPALPTWKKMTELRKDKYEISSLPDDYEARKEAMQIYQLLQEPIEIEDADQVWPLKDAMEYLYDVMKEKGKTLPVLLNAEAFRAEDPDEWAPPKTPYEVPVKFPPFPKRMSIGTAMKFLLSQIPTQNATFVIRKNHIEITTIDSVDQEKVLRVYPVGELVMPISPMGGMMGMMGMPMMGGMGMMGMPMMGGMGMGGMPMMGGMGMGGMGMGMMGMGGMGMGGPMMGGMGMGGMPMMGGMGMGGMGMMDPFGMGGMGMMGMGGMGMGGMGMMGMMGMGGMAGGFNGNLGFMGATQAQPLIQLITQVVAPGKWGLTPMQTAFQQTQGGFAAQAGFVGLVGQFGAGFGAPFAGMAGAAGFGAPFAGAAGAAGFGAPFAGAAGAAGFAPAPGIVGFQGPGLEPLNIDYSELNTIEFFAPALALVVRAPSQIHYKDTGGLLGGARKKDAIAGPGIPGLGLLDPKAGKGAVAGLQDQDPDKLKNLDPKKIWDQALAQGADPGLVIATADFLVEQKAYDHATEFLKATLRQGVIIQPWVYEALAIAMDLSGGGTPEELKRLHLSSLSLQPHNALSFLRAAEAMAKHKDWSQALAYCRQAAELEPNWPEAYELALEYAKSAKDGEALAWAAGELLRRDWPLDNETFHLKAKNAVSQMLSALGSGHKSAAQLQEILQQSQQRDLIIKLHWVEGPSGPADFELIVKEPNGSVCSSQQRLTPGGGTLMGNNLKQLTRASYVAAEAFSGDYEVTVQNLWGQSLGGKVILEIIQHDGTDKKQSRRLTLPIGEGKHTEKFTLQQGSRTEVAVLPPVLPQSRSGLKKEESINVLAKFRELADPYHSKTAQGFMGGIGTSMAAAPLSLQPLPMQKSAKMVWQTALPGKTASGVNLTASTTVTGDGKLQVQVIPSFSNLHQADFEPAIQLPLIPGGKAS